MRPPTIPPPEDTAAPPAAARPAPLLTEQLYAEHWQYVLDLVSSYGVAANDQRDVAQTVWENVHARIASYEPGRHPTPRAWLAGFVRRCAANRRRTVRRKPEVLTADPAALSRAGGLNPEEWEIVQTALWRAIRNDERREAFVLHFRFGLTIDEIAEVTGVRKTTVSFRLLMANHDLKADSEEKSTKAGAFLGFGTLEALIAAMRPKPRPFEEGAELWNRIAEHIQREEGGAEGDGPPSSIGPAVPALPALEPSPPASEAAVTLTKKKLAALVAGIFVSGIAAGAGGLLAWQAYDAARSRREAQALQPRSMEAPPMLTAATPGPGPALSTSAAARPAAESSTTASPPAASPATEGTGPVLADDSMRLILRMQRAAQAASFATVLVLADEHARRFGGEQIRERETQRIEALSRLGRSTEAEARARAVAAKHPEHRSAMERAIGHSLPAQ